MILQAAQTLRTTLSPVHMPSRVSRTQPRVLPLDFMRYVASDILAAVSEQPLRPSIDLVHAGCVPGGCHTPSAADGFDFVSHYHFLRRHRHVDHSTAGTGRCTMSPVTQPYCAKPQMHLDGTRLAKPSIFRAQRPFTADDLLAAHVDQLCSLPGRRLTSERLLLAAIFEGESILHMTAVRLNTLLLLRSINHIPRLCLEGFS